jgi:hypothetical protein
MKLKVLFALEIAIIVGVLAFALAYLWVTPYLGSSQQYGSMESYSQKSNPVNYLSLEKGQPGIVRFNYTSYDPAIVVLDLRFDSIDSLGDFDIFCNYRHVATISVTPETQKITLNLVSFSGLDWVEPMTSMFGLNDLVFESNSPNGYAGIIAYQISFRGTR